MDSNKDVSTKKKNSVVFDCIFLAILVLLPFLHLAFGVEFTDTAYSLGNYQNLDKMNLTWTVATFWANMLGKFFSMLPLGKTWIGMKFYTTLVPLSAVVSSYFFLRKYIPKWIVFIGELLAISLCWCPTTILYNYASYLLFTLAVIILIVSLVNEKRWGLFVAGIILAFNVFVRFPNITEVSLILLVWYSARINKKKFLYGLWDTLICIGGFVTGVFVNLLIVGALYGFTSVPNMIRSLFSMTGDNTGYRPTSMVMAILRGYTKYTKSFLFLLGITVLCFAVSALMRRHFMRITTIVAQFVLYGGFLFWGFRNHVFTVNYADYPSMEFWLVMFFVLGNILSFWTLLRKRRNKEHKLLALASLIIIWITPLGSNNALYPSINNLFIAAPVVLFLCYNELFKGRNFYELLDLEAKNTMVATRITIALLFVSIFVNSILFGFVFIFRDSGFPYNNHYEIEGNSVLVGMHTNKERKAVIENLTQYVKDSGLEGHSAIFYGNLPGLEYILKMPCAISHTWPDLGSFSYSEFERDINSLDEYPIIFINEEYCDNIFDLGDDASAKEICLSGYMESNGYTLKVRIGNIALYSNE